MNKKKISSWLSAFRLRTLPLALACIGLGGFMAATNSAFDMKILIWTTITALLLQILSNLANDLGDTMNGADSEKRQGPARAVQSGSISMKEMKIAIVICALASLASGLYLLMIAEISLRDFLIFLAMGLIAIVAALNYTMGKNPYGYIGLGDIAVFIFFGLISVLGSFYLHTGYMDPWILLPASACGLLSVAVLNVNNIRDIDSDLMAGKITMAVKLGRKKAEFYHFMLLVIALALALVYVLNHYQSPFQFLFLVSVPFILQNGIAVRKYKDPRQLDPFLKQMAISTVIFALSFGLGQIL